MPTLTLDIVIFVVFLGFNLIIGLAAGRRVKTLREYAVGRKKFSDAALTSTILATWISGIFLFYSLEKIYTGGLRYIIVMMGGTISLILTGRVLAIRMGGFLNDLSVAKTMGDLYGKTIRITTAISGVISAIAWIAIQFQIIGKMLTLLLGFQGPGVTIFAAAIVIFYSAFGGIRSVTITDVFQFMTFSIFIPMLALIVWNNLKTPDQVVHTLTDNPNFSLQKVVSWDPELISSICMMLFFGIPSLSTPMFQRIVMASSIQQIKRSFTYAAGIRLLMIMAVAWISILLLADNPSIEPSKLLNYIINRYTYPGLKGLIAVGITALSMSTADSYLNTSAVLSVHDIIKPLNPSFIEKISIVRIFSICIGILGLILALYTKNIIYLALLSGSFYMPIVTVPLLLAIFGFRSTTRAVLIGMGAGFIAVAVWRICFAYTGINSVIPGMAANLICLMGSHYLLGEKGGWQKVDPSSPLALAREARRQAWKRRIKTIRRFKLYLYLQQNLPNKDYFYFFFGLYTIAATYAAFYTIGEAQTKIYQDIYEAIYHTVLFATTAFLTFPIWPPTVKKQQFIAFFWPLGICGILFFAGTLLVIMSHFHIMQVMILMINLLMALLLLRWPLALILASSGIVGAVIFFKQYTGLPTLPGDFGSLQFRVIYGLLLFSSFLIALFKHKQATEKLKAKNVSLTNTNQETTHELLTFSQDQAKFIKTFRESGALGLNKLVALSKRIVQKTKELNLSKELIQDITQLHEKLTPIALHLDKLDHRATGYLRLEVTTIKLDTLLEAVEDKLHVQGLAKYISWRRITKHKEVQCDVGKIASVLVNSISFIRNVASKERPILLALEDTQLGYPISTVEPDYTKKISALRITLTTARTLPILEELYLAQMGEEILPTPETTTDLPLVTNERIIRAHYGYNNTLANGNELTQIYAIPIKLREVRSKDMDSPAMELGAEIVRADDTYPGAQEQE
ncbi:MAG: sodium:solute symporter family protein, partial [Bacteroidota bacterium]